MARWTVVDRNHFGDCWPITAKLVTHVQKYAANGLFPLPNSSEAYPPLYMEEKRLLAIFLYYLSQIRYTHIVNIQVGKPSHIISTSSTKIRGIIFYMKNLLFPKLKISIWQTIIQLQQSISDFLTFWQQDCLLPVVPLHDHV